MLNRHLQLHNVYQGAVITLSICRRLTTMATTLEGLMSAIVLGDKAQGLSTTLLKSAYARRLLLDPGCLRLVASNCYNSSDAFYVVSVTSATCS